MKLSSILKELINYDNDKGVRRSVFGNEENIQTLQKFYEQTYRSMEKDFKDKSIPPKSTFLTLPELESVEPFMLENKVLFELAQIIARNNTVAGSASAKVFENLAAKFCTSYKLRSYDISGSNIIPVLSGELLVDALKFLEAANLLNPANFASIVLEKRIPLDVIVRLGMNKQLTQERLDAAARKQFEIDLDDIFVKFPALKNAKSLSDTRALDDSHPLPRGLGLEITGKLSMKEQTNLREEICRLGGIKDILDGQSYGDFMVILSRGSISGIEYRDIFIRLEQKINEIQNRYNAARAQDALVPPGSKAPKGSRPKSDAEKQLLAIIKAKQELEMRDINKIKDLLWDPALRGNTEVLEQARKLELDKELGYTPTVNILSYALKQILPEPRSEEKVAPDKQLISIITSSKIIEGDNLNKIKDLLWHPRLRGNMRVLEEARALELNKSLGYTPTVALINKAIREYEQIQSPVPKAPPAPKVQQEPKAQLQLQPPPAPPQPKAQPESSVPVYIKGFAAALKMEAQNLDPVQIGNALLKLSGINHPQDRAGFSIEQNADNTIAITFTLNDAEKRQVQDYFEKNFTETEISSFSKKSDKPKNFTLIVSTLGEILVAIRRQNKQPAPSIFNQPAANNVGSGNERNDNTNKLK